jgi:hypothetical protein
VFLEGRLCHKVAVQEHVEGFHDLASISCHVTQTMARL